MASQTIMDPGKKWAPGLAEGTLTAGVAAVVGAVHSLNFATLTNGEYGQTKAPTTADIVHGVPMVALTTAAQGGQGYWCCRGYAKAAVSLTAEALAIGDPLVFVNAGQHFVKAAGSGVDAKIVAKAMEVVGSTTAVVTVKVCLFGEAGCGISEA